MQKKRVSLAISTLKVLEKKPFDKVDLLSLTKKHKDISVKNKRELIANINRYFDFLLKNNLSGLEESSKKDMLFEVLMARLDILNSYRVSVKNIMNYLYSNPKNFIKIIPSFIESIILISTLCNINVNGIKGIPIIKSIFILYLLIIYSWSSDETKGLEKTMTVLDKYLNNINKITKIF